MAHVIRFFTSLLDGEPWPSGWHVRSDFLVAQPSFMSGAARVLDLRGCFDAYNYSRSTHEADHFALLADWHVVGGDAALALDRFSQEPEVRRLVDSLPALPPEAKQMSLLNV